MSVNEAKVKVSFDEISKMNNNFWIYEQCENEKERIYLNDEASRLLGLDKDLSPEEVFDFLVENLDTKSLNLLKEGKEKAVCGEKCEIRISWNHPSGKKFILRIFGIRNSNYKDMIRIEGKFSDITDMLVFDDTNLEKIKQQEIEITKSKLHAEALSFVSVNNPSVDEFIHFIGKRIIETFGCDQVVYHNLEGKKIVYNAPGIESVPEDLCKECSFESCRGNKKLSVQGTIVMNDCAKGYMGENVHPQCTVKSSLIQQIFSHNQVVGFININYINEYHTFSKDGIELMKGMAAYLGIIVDKIELRKIEEKKYIEEVTLAQSKKNREIIEILASEYTSVYYIDLKTDELNPYTMNDSTKSAFGSILNAGITYSQAFNIYVEKLVADDDKSMMLNAGSIINIRENLKDKKTYITTYRSKDGKYNEMKFVKVGDENDEPVAVALGFADKDEAIRTEIGSRLQRQRYNAVIKALSSEYSSVYYADIENDILMPYNNSGRITDKFGQDAFYEMSYYEAAKMYVNYACKEEYKKELLEKLSASYMKEQLLDKQYYTYIYQNDKDMYCEMKCVRADDSEKIQNIVVGFAVKDEEIRSKILIEQEREMNFDIIEILASEYTSVYYIDLATDGLNPYTMNKETESEFGKIFNSGISFSKAFGLYVDKLVYGDDKDFMLKAGSIENIKRELYSKKTYITTYRDKDNKYCEMKFVKVGGDLDKPEAVALGFAQKDDEIREKQIKDAEQKMNFDIIEILASEYTSVYYINLATDGLNPYTMNEETEMTFGSVFRSGITYSEAFSLYVERLVFEDDRAIMLKAGSIGNIIRELKDKKTFLTTFRDKSGKYSEMKFVKVGNENDVPEAVALGFAQKDEQIRREQKIAAENRMNFDIIEVLASEYTSVYYIDLTTDALNTYTMNEETETTFGSVFNSEITYSEAFGLYVDKLVYDDDKEMMLRAGSIGNIMRQLAEKKTFITTYRSADNKYSEMKFVKVGGDYETPVAVALGFAEKDDEIRDRQIKEAEQKMNFDIIEILASEYTSVYYIDLTTDGLNPYTMNEETETTFGSVFRSGITYSEAFGLYVDSLVYSDDKEMMLKTGSVDNIKEELKDKKTFITTYRDSEGRYSEMKFVKVGGDNDIPVAVALGFAQKDEQIRQKMLENIERQRNFDIIEVLASEYTSVYYIDLTTDELNPYTMNEETQTTFGSVIKSGITYSEAFNLYVDSLVFEDDKTKMLKAGSIDNIINELTSQKTFITSYRDKNGRYSEMKFVKVGDENDTPEAVALGFSEKDDPVKQHEIYESELQRNFDIIEILASEYTSVYYIDLITDGLTTYRMDDETENTFGSLFKSDISYSEAFRLYVDSLVYSEDKRMMLKAGSIGNIMKELKKQKTFITTYRNKDGRYSEMKFVKVGNEEKMPEAVALGFADKDEELRAKREEERILSRNIDIIEILASEYSSVYYIDMTTDELDPYTMNEQVENKFGDIFRSGIKYSEAFRMYVNNLVYPDDKEDMLKAGSVYNILKELATKKTFLTTYRDDEGKYCEMKFVKVGNDENPEAVALGFANKDEEIRASIERETISARDAAVISGLSDDFGCVVYVNFDDFDEIHYRFDSLFEKTIPGWSRINNFRERLEKLTNTIMHPDDRKAFYDATKPEIVKEEVKKGAYFVNFRTLIDNETTYYQAKFVSDENTKDHIIAGFHNVDAETKREMEALEAAENASRAKTDFLFNMSHDIRTPMNAIIGFTNKALRDAKEPEKVKENLKKVLLSSDMLLTLINDILDMSRIESGKATLNEEKTNLDDVFENIKPVMSSLAVSKNIDLTFNTINLNDRYVFLDKVRLDRVLVNIISNGIKYTKEGGFVKVSFEQLDSYNEEKGIFKFVIEDNGIGMSKDFQKKMFEEFTREENSTTNGIQGTGLGLALAKKLTNMMNGSISCESEKDKGSKFTIILPFRLQSREEVLDAKFEEKHILNINLEGRRILLVEDNELNREIATDILEEENIIVEEASNGQNAVEMVLEKDKDYYDFILMDIQMPIMNGYEATAKIRKEMPDLKAPIIALSANAFEEDKKKSIEAGMNAHVAKPINVEELKNVLAKFVLM